MGTLFQVNNSVTVVEASHPNRFEAMEILQRLSSQGPLSPALLEAALDDAHNGLLIFDSSLRALHSTSQILPLLGVRKEDLGADVDVISLLTKSTLEAESIANAKRAIAGLTAETPVEPILLKSQDQRRTMRLRLRSIGPQHRLAVFESEASFGRINAAITEFALRDSLTGLASRPYFEEAVATALREKPNEPLAILLIDLDRFKAVNDTLGHAAGDTLLRLASERLRSAVRKDDLVARLGGDEFAVLIDPCTTLDELTAIAQRVMDLVQRTYLIEGQLVNIGTSIGISRSPLDGNTYIPLLRNADLALYHSKTSGRSSYHFFELHMERRAQARRTSELELRRALALRQLEVFYQPQVNTDSGCLFGFEALIRWRHPEKGLIPPNDFLPIAEEIGLIVPIGDWVLRTACAEAMKWPADITIAVNVSPLQFDAGRFADTVRKALRSSGLPGTRLELEVTEGILLRNDESVLGVLHDLRSLGVRIAMDDFGTGYASLSQLARFPFDKIKIDRSLAGFEGENLKQRAIVRAITALGHSLGVCTLAEGVENSDQIERLKNDGCSSVQGYFFSKPVPSSQLEEMICRLHTSPNKSLSPVT